MSMMSPAAGAAASSNANGNGRNHRSTKRRKKIAVPSAAWPILFTLLAANFVALLVHVWYFLPPGRDALLVGAPPASFGGRTFKKRVRRKQPHDGGGRDGAASVEALGAALSNDDEVRYDVVPRILNDARSYGVVHQLPSIPDRRRMIPDNDNNHFRVPPDAVRNLTYFLESQTRKDEEDRPLFLYNPMVLPLDETVIGDAILSDLRMPGSDVDERPSYVAAYRASDFGNCHGPGRGVPDSYQNYLGLALLDGDLNILRDPNSGEYLDAVIDMNQHLYDIDWSPIRQRSRPPKPRQFMQDCQLFAPRQSSKSANDGKAERLILLCNEYAMPVRLQVGRNGQRDNNASSGNDKNGGEDEKIFFTNKYGSGLRLTGLQKPNMILYREKNMNYGAKNMHYIPPSNNVGAFLEIWPGGPHELLPLDFDVNPYVVSSFGGDPQKSVLKSPKSEPNASFATIDGRDGKGALIDRDSGSACCVPIRWSDGRRLLLGFSHRKTRRRPKKQRYGYVSRLYAFEPTPPFDIVARSGFFCLGFAPTRGDEDGENREALQSDNEQIWGAANEYRLKIRGKEFDCPRIHFVSGIAEKMGDEDTVIVSYGVNDCYPRMVEVSKDFLVSLLKGRR